MEIELRREWIIGAIVAVVVGALGLLGWAVSPKAADGRPVLLLPDVRAVETYRVSVVQWVKEWQGLDTAMYDLLASDKDTDLLNQSRKAQAAFDQSVTLAVAVDGASAPTALMS